MSAVLLALGAPWTVDATLASVGASEVAGEVWVSVARSPDPDDASASSGAEDNPLRPLIGPALLAMVFVLGLKAVKRQRDEGRRSKLPPIG